MIQPTENEALTLATMERAGGSLELGPDLPLRLGLGGLLTITTDRPQRGVLTTRGRSAQRELLETW